MGDPAVIGPEIAIKALRNEELYRKCRPLVIGGLNTLKKMDKIIVLSLYHDQGHTATKTVDFERTISLAIGLPFLRTSVDHGTVFDIAGQGIASSVSMEEAIRLAAEYSYSVKS